MTELKKDPMILFKTVIAGKNSKGADRFQLYLTPEQLTNLVTAAVEANTASEGRGVKLDLHISDKEFEGRAFKSAIAFVKATQNPPGQGSKPRAFVPKAVSTTD